MTIEEERLRARIIAAVEALPGGWCELARRANVDRSSLWRSFKSKKHRGMTLNTVLEVLPHLGLRIELRKA